MPGSSFPGLSAVVHQPLSQEADSLPQPGTIAPIFRDETLSPGQACMRLSMSSLLWVELRRIGSIGYGIRFARVSRGRNRAADR